MKLLTVAVFILLQAANCFAQVSDLNGDGIVKVLGFGDSLTYGVGDSTNPGEEVAVAPITNGTLGYIRILKELSGLAVLNRGIPGEALTEFGIDRFPSEVLQSKADIIVIFEGTNDSAIATSSNYSNAVQQVVNITVALGLQPILVTMPEPCCNRADRIAEVASFSAIVKDRGNLNQVVIADVERAWKTTCEDPSACELYNLPEGLHPNSKGYEVIAQTILAAIYGIDIFSPGGAHELESALGLPAGAVIVKPSAVQG